MMGIRSPTPYRSPESLKAKLNNRELLRRFDLELQVLVRLHHPAVAHIYEETDDPVVVIVRELQRNL